MLKSVSNFEDAYYVVKRSGKKEPVHFDKITKRISNLLTGNMKTTINVIDIVKKTISGIYPGITTKTLDEQSAYQCAMMTTKHPDYSLLAGRIYMSGLQKETTNLFVEKMEYIHNKTNLFNEDWLSFIQNNRKKLNRVINYERDLDLDYFGVKTMERIYLTKIDGVLVERPQDVFMRVASTVNMGNLDRTIESYNLMSRFHMTHASPTLFNSGNKNGNLISCFLLGTEDSMLGITKTWNDVSQISKWGGGIGVHISNIRGKGSKIKGTNGKCDGIIPMLQVYNSICRYVNQCFTPDTSIITRNGIKRIENICVGDEVMTFEHSWKRVLSVFKREIEESILSIKTNLGEGLKCTKVHEILVLKKDHNKFKYYPASELMKGDTMIYPRGGKYIYNEILEIIDVDYKGLVYDLNVEDNHNYLTTHGIVHNSGKRKGSFAMYLEPHHVDVFDFLDLRKNTGSESDRARDLFLALWVSDLFMKKVENDEKWYLFCPDEAPGLNDVYGDEYEKLYNKYVDEKRYRKEIKARKLWEAIEIAQFETGSPYMLYKDNINNKSNQKNIGTIRSSNLCAEIVEYSDNKETACCNLASLSLSSFVKDKEIEKSGWVVYSIENCKYCRWCKSLLENNDIIYEEIKVEKDDDNYKKLKGDKERITFPCVYIGDKYIGGMEDVWVYMGREFDYKKLWDVAYHTTINLDKVIDLNSYPTIEGRRSNMRHRPVGLGVQGLADTLAMLRVPYSSERALELNRNIFGVIYHASLSASNDITIEREVLMRDLKLFFEEHPKLRPKGEFYDSSISFSPKKMEKVYHQLRPNSFELDLDEYIGGYSSFKGSPFSEGKLQYHLWGVSPIEIDKLVEGKSWEVLIDSIKKYGTRNSLLTALMPTASTSQLLNNYESFEPFTSNLYTRRTLAGEFIVINKHLVRDLIELNEWNEDNKNIVIAYNGSIVNLDLPGVVRETYLNAYEMKQKWIMEGCKARGAYIDQTQSMNLYFEKPDSQKLYASQMWAWKNGLKTGLYYLRSKPSANAQKITLDPMLLKRKDKKEMKDEEECLMCSA